MYGKGISEKISMLFSFVIISLLIYAGTAWAINRIVGSNVVGGDGLILSADGRDTLHVLTDGTMRINNDSTGIDTTNLWTLANLHYSAKGDIHDTLWAHLDESTAVLWTAIHDTAWMLRDAIHDSLFANTPNYLDEDDTDNIKDTHIDWGSGAGQVNLDDFDDQTAWRLFYSNTDGDVTELGFGTDGQYLKSSGAAVAPTWDTPAGAGDADKSDIHDSLWANSPGYSTNSEIHDSLNANWSTWLDGDAAESEIGDSLWAHLDDTSAVLWTAIHDTAWMVKDAIGDTLWAHLDESTAVLWTAIHDTAWMLRDAIHDSIAAQGAGAYTQFWGENDLAISWGTDDSVDVFYPVSEKFGNVTHPYFVRNINASAAADDQKDTLVFSGRLPLGFTSDIDSITIGYRTSTTTAATSGIKATVYAMCDLSGFAPADTVKAVGAQTASGSAGVWDWLTFVMADSSAIGAGSWIMVLVECEMDFTAQAETVDVERPYFWGVGK